MMYVTQRELRLERILSCLDRDYANHYQELIEKVSKKIDLFLTDTEKMNNQIKVAKSSVVNISFESEFSRFFEWATYYRWYRFHLFLGYNDIEQLLLSKCSVVKWINNYEVQLTINKPI